MSGTARRLSGRPVAMLLLALALGGAMGCARGPSDEQRVRATLAEFARATATRDYRRICERLLAPELLEDIREIGYPCELAWSEALEGLREPRMTVGEVRVEGARASARIRTSASGQEPAEDVAELVRADGRWRISRLEGGSSPTGRR